MKNAREVFEVLSAVTFSKEDSNSSEALAEVLDITRFMNIAIKGDDGEEIAYFGTINNFAYDSEESMQDAVKQICKRIDPKYPDDRTKDLNDRYGNKPGPDKPFIFICNTVTSKTEHSQDTEASGGSHWISWVLLPKKNNKYQIMFFDSLGQYKFPKALSKYLTHGGEFTDFNPDEVEQKDVARYFYPLCKPWQLSVDDVKKAKHQNNGHDCGWWAVYYALMTVYTGNIDFLKKIDKLGLVSAEPLRKCISLTPENKSPTLISDSSSAEQKSENLSTDHKADVITEKPHEEAKNSPPKEELPTRISDLDGSEQESKDLSTDHKDASVSEKSSKDDLHINPENKLLQDILDLDKYEDNHADLLESYRAKREKKLGKLASKDNVKAQEKTKEKTPEIVYKNYIAQYLAQNNFHDERMRVFLEKALKKSLKKDLEDLQEDKESENTGCCSSCCGIFFRFFKTQRFNITFSLVSSIVLAVLAASKLSVVLATDEDSVAAKSMDIVNVFVTAVMSAIDAYLSARFINNANHIDTQKKLLKQVEEDNKVEDLEEGISQLLITKQWFSKKLDKIEEEHQEKLNAIRKKRDSRLNSASESTIERIFDIYLQDLAGERSRYITERRIIYKQWKKNDSCKVKELINKPNCRCGGTQKFNIIFTLFSAILLALLTGVESAVILATNKDSTVSLTFRIISIFVTAIVSAMNLFLMGGFMINANDIYVYNNLIVAEEQKSKDYFRLFSKYEVREETHKIESERGLWARIKELPTLAADEIRNTSVVKRISKELSAPTPPSNVADEAEDLLPTTSETKHTYKVKHYRETPPKRTLLSDVARRL